MRRGGILTACLLAWPAAAADKPVEPPDPEFLEFLAETAALEEDEQFVEYMESRRGERELQRAEERTAKEDDDE